VLEYLLEHHVVIRRRELCQGQLPVTCVHEVYLPSQFILMALLSGLCLPL
jgi:hypothetical protein